ncbi:cytochrome c biogenesis ATP-binding export protein CcmA [Kushneria pakistanensis]|uniref:Cytochrome c biogenesis ATP-binding export protein CcmA n=1 Tax=Kushneria pakistanensis TaxID=1508770 RepID=A0ABQ3FJE1_9GAMM|nr:cytochrome c biogenesis heme-transporting ATPase CcmA [Kushneria pakistanensis]GHC25853.1 cytochrome c biogenesis ATP-binding export protein CcmA [Kushneria pakistanensis]
MQLDTLKLGCERDERWLFSDLDWQIRSGELWRIEGPNGSGKTTLLRILSGQMADYTGTLLWQGEPLARCREAFMASMLYIGHRPGIKKALTALENLDWYQAMSAFEKRRGVRRDACFQALAEVGLAGFEETPVENLSAGQQRRVALARLALGHQRLWILDEPFTAIDRAGVRQLEGWMMAHCRAGGSVVVTSHHDSGELLPSSGVLKNLRFDGQGGVHVDC